MDVKGVTSITFYKQLYLYITILEQWKKYYELSTSLI